MLPFRPPPGNGMPVVPGNLPPPRGMPPPVFVPGMLAMRGPPPRGPPPMGFPPGRGPPPQGMIVMMMPRGPMPAPSNTTSGSVEVDHAAPAELGSITLFVGKLPTELKDNHIRNLLEKCGNVESWRRIIDPVTSKPKAFGYCTYASAMDAQRALRLLNGFSIDSTQIVVKADNKTQTKMDEQASAMKDATIRGEHQHDDELRRELKSLEDERSKREGRLPNDTKASDKFIENQAKKTSTEDQDEMETPATTQGDASDDQESAEGVQVQEKMIQSAIEKFRSSQNQREQTVNDKNHATAHESARHANEEQRTAPEEPKSEIATEVLEQSVEAISNAEPRTLQPAKAASTADQNNIAPEEMNAVEIPKSIGDHTHERKDAHGREKRDRREERKRGRYRSRSHSRERSRRRRRSRSYSRSRSRSRGRERELRRDRKRDRESDRRRRRRRNNSAVDEEIDGERRTKRRRDSRSDDLEPGTPTAEQPAAADPVAAVKVVMDLKMSLGTAKKEKALSGLAPSLFKVEDVVESKPVRDFVRIDFAEEERRANALAQQKAAETAAKINRRTVDVKTLIDSIPTDKKGLFAFPIDWVAAEKHHIIKNKMQPWVTKKVLEYLGEEDATLISFILNKLQAKAKPDDILGELQAILEDDAEVFVKSLWRKLAFEALHAGA